MRVSAVLAAVAVGEFSIYGDCGSTATRVYLIEVANASVAPRIEKIGKGPAVTAVLDDPSRAASFVDLVAKALAKVPAESRRTVTVTGLATAGMRSRTDEEQRAVWRALRGALDEAEHAAVGGRVLTACEPPPGADPWCEERVSFRTISGHEEGVFGLVAANALARLENPGSSVVGVLDLGGTSTQLALPHSEVGAVELARPGPGGPSFVRSYDWGMERARVHFATPTCFAADVALSQVNASWAGQGAPDAPACRRAIRAGLRAEVQKCEAVLGCLGEPVAWASTPLLAMSGFFYVADYANWVASVPGYPSPLFTDLEAAADVVCATSAASLEGRPHPFTDAVKQQHRCFELNYLLELFALYSLPDDGRVRFVGHIAGTEVEWTLGAYLVDRQAAKYV